MSSTERGRLATVPGGRFLRRTWRLVQRAVAVHGAVSLGKGVSIGQGSVVRSLHGLTIGDHVHIGRNCTIEVDGRIGSHVLMAAGVAMVGRDDHAIDEFGTAMVDSTWIGDRLSTPRDQVSIGCDVWLGYGAIVLSGVAIGDGAVVAAGTVVTRDVAPFAIVAGNPARTVGERLRGTDRAEHIRRILE